MAKKNAKCKNPMCLFCRWWPKISKFMGADCGCYWVNEETGEVFVASGLRLLPNGILVKIPDTESQGFYGVECECGEEGFVRADLLDKGLTTRCPECAASIVQITRN